MDTSDSSSITAAADDVMWRVDGMARGGGRALRPMTPELRSTGFDVGLILVEHMSKIPAGHGQEAAVVLDQQQVVPCGLA